MTKIRISLPDLCNTLRSVYYTLLLVYSAIVNVHYLTPTERFKPCLKYLKPRSIANAITLNLNVMVSKHPNIRP